MKTTRYPIVLVHGLWGFDNISILGIEVATYFNGVEAQLKELGYTVYTTKVGKTNSIQQRAQQLKSQLLEIDAKKVNIIAHSMGGLDARYMITNLGMADRVASLTTVGTPHRGTAYADWGVEKRAQSIALLKLVGFETEGYYDLTRIAMKTMNEKTPDMSQVHYFSYAGSREKDKIHPYLRRGFKVLFHSDGENDGMVPVMSARWGEFLGILEADHFEQVGWGLGKVVEFRKKDKFEHLTFYAKHAGLLAERGF